MEALFKGVRGLLVRCKPTGEKLIANKTLGHTVWCCNGAFSVKSTCTLAYCKSCSERMQGLEEKKRGGSRRTRRGGGGGKDDRVGTVVISCDKGDC